MTVDDVPDAEPNPGEVVVRSEAAGICGSEVEGYLGRMANRMPPLVMGHEFAGTVTAVGAGVDRSWIGKRVAVNPIVGCGHCSYCARGDRNLCPDRYLVGVGSPGGFASSAVLSAVIFNALIIVALIPLALRGIRYRPIGAAALLRRNLLIYGLGGIIAPFAGIKLIDVLITAIHLA